MLPELLKNASPKIEISSMEEGRIQEGLANDNFEVVTDSEKVFDLPEASEVSQKQLEEGTKILQPDMELIKTQSLEAVKQSNIEKTQSNIEKTQVSVKENDEFRELTDKDKQYLRENTNLSETAIENIRVDADGKYHLKCRNEELAGRNHETTGVKYVEKTITVDGIEIIVVVPEFTAVFECKISEELWKKGDREIFKNCIEQLRDYLKAHPEMKSQFNEQQLDQIMNGEPYIKGYTWHHSEIPGKMQLVENRTHALSGHTGGNLIWCGGIR